MSLCLAVFLWVCADPVVTVDPVDPVNTGVADIEARFSITPLSVEVGEPFELALDVRHSSTTSVFDLDLGSLELDTSWVLLDTLHTTAQPLPAEPGRSVTRWAWSLVSLEPSAAQGGRSLLHELTSLVTDPRVTSIEIGDSSIQVVSVLDESEDEPRPLRGPPAGFLDLVSEAEDRRAGYLVGGAGFLLLLIAYLVIVRRRGRSAPSARELAPLAALEQLRSAQDTTPAAVRSVYFELTRLVRSAADRAGAGVSRGGLTDAEWLVLLQREGSFPEELTRGFEELFEECEGVKYAGRAPTEWALEETFGRVRTTLEALRSRGRVA